MDEKYLLECWACTSKYDASEASFCSHIDPTLICPFCLKCACDAPKEYRNNLLKNCPKEILEEKLILEGRISLKLGEILIKAGKITKHQLISAIEKQKFFKKRIGQIFILMGLITSDELSLYLLEQKWIDKINLKNFEISFDLVEKIGKNFCLTKKIIPIDYYKLNNEKILSLVISKKEDLAELKKSEELKDCILIPYEALLEDIERLLQEIKDNDILVLK